MPKNPEYEISDIIYAIHEEQDITRLRKKFMGSLNKLIPHDKSFFDLGYKKGTKVVFYDPVSVNIEKEQLDSFFKKYILIDTMFWFFAQDENHTYRDSDYVSDTMLMTSAFYKEWMAPQNIYYGMGSVVSHNDILYGSVTLWRSKDSGDFTDEEISLLETLNNHLSLQFGKLYPKGISKKHQMNQVGAIAEIYHLTQREKESALLVAQGLTTSEISEKMFISESTVKKHLHSIFKKLNVKNRAQLINIIHQTSTNSNTEK